MRANLPFLLLLTACPKTAPTVPDAPVAPATPTVDVPAAPEGLAEHMGDHYVHATTARDALVRGDLDDAQEAMRWMVGHHTTDSLPDSLKAPMIETQLAAKGVMDATDLHTASEALARTAATCGACHGSVKAGPTFPEPAPPSDGADVSGHMARHQWAADRMWEGLIAPSDFSWNLGAESLSQEALKSSELGGDPLPAEAIAYGQRLHDLGAQGIEATTPEDRATLYGSFLATCAGCHALINPMSAPPTPE